MCVPAGYVLSYWNRPFFPEFCSDATMDDSVTYDTTVRIAGSFVGVAHVFKVIADTHRWTHVVLVSDDETESYCWYVAPCGLRGCKNRPAPFPRRISYKATKRGSVYPLS